MTNNVASVMLFSEEPEVVSLSVGLEKAREEAASARAHLDALRAAIELIKGERNIALAKVREQK